MKGLILTSGTVAAPADPVVRPAPGIGAAAVVRLRLTDFRNYRQQTVLVEPGLVIVTGSNGAGKTNLLEALSLLGPGRGLRRARLADFKRHGATAGWGVAATIRGRHGDEARVATGQQPASGNGTAAPERRTVLLEGRTSSAQRLGELIHFVWLTPQMDRLFLDGAAPRRRFIDQIVYGFDPAHARRTLDYERTMRERNRLLRSGGADPAWLAALEELLAHDGVAIAAARRYWVTRLNAALPDQVHPFPAASVHLEGEIDDWLAAQPAVAVEDRVREALAANRVRDAETGRATMAPHRVDLMVRHAAKAVPAAQCSTGEQKALLIGLVLGSARLQTVELGAPPVLLLDEVTAHLDGDRRMALFAALGALGGQVWLTGTDADLFRAVAGDGQYLSVIDGTLDVDDN